MRPLYEVPVILAESTVKFWKLERNISAVYSTDKILSTYLIMGDELCVDVAK